MEKNYSNKTMLIEDFLYSYENKTKKDFSISFWERMQKEFPEILMITKKDLEVLIKKNGEKRRITDKKLVDFLTNLGNVELLRKYLSNLILKDIANKTNKKSYDDDVEEK